MGCCASGQDTTDAVAAAAADAHRAMMKGLFDADNKDARGQDATMRQAMERLAPFRSKLRICRNFSTVCAGEMADESIDFVYIDARHDYKGAMQDLHAYWPKVRPGGIFAGHDYVYASEHPWFATGKSDYSINFDGTRDPLQRAVKGAVDDFFSACVPRQVSVTYRDESAPFVSWMVRK